MPTTSRPAKPSEVKAADLERRLNPSRDEAVWQAFLQDMHKLRDRFPSKGTVRIKVSEDSVIHLSGYC